MAKAVAAVISVEEAEHQIQILSGSLKAATNGAIAATYRCVTCKKLSTEHTVKGDVKGCNLCSAGLDIEAHANDVNKQYGFASMFSDYY